MRILKFEIASSERSRAISTETDRPLARTAAPKARVARTAGRNWSSRSGWMRGLMRKVCIKTVTESWIKVSRWSIRRTDEPHWNVLLSQETLYIAHSKFAEVEDAGGQDGIGFSLGQDLRHVFEFTRPSTGHHGDPDRFADPAGDHNIKARLRAIRIDAIQDDFSRTQRHSAAGPLNRVQAGRSP